MVDPDGYSWTTDKDASTSVDENIRAVLIEKGFGVVQLPNLATYGFTNNNPDNADQTGNGAN